MNERVLAAEAKDAKRHVLDSGTRCLSVNQVSEYKKNLQYFLYEDILYIALIYFKRVSSKKKSCSFDLA